MSQKKVQLLNPLSGNINVAGIITASSFSGDGAGLTGVASTDNIQTATEATFLSGVKITGVTTASGGVVGNLTGNVTGNADTATTATNAQGLTGTPTIAVTNISGVAATFSGNVSLGGTLTYQDVTNMDVLGIGTFQQGIQVLANGVDVTGIGTFEDRITYDGSLEQAGGGTVTYAVTVASKDSTHRYNGQGSGNAYIIDNLQSPIITLTPGRTYRFTNDNTGSHPLKFYYQADKTTLYTTGVTFDNSYTEIAVTDTTPAVLHYQCTNHSLMGNAVFTQSNPIVGAGITLNADGGGVHVTGIVTASTVKVGSAISLTDGAVAATRFHGDGTNLTGIDASPSIAATAVGSISDGQALIVTNNGSVTGIATTSNSVTTHGTAVSATATYYNWYASTVDTDENKFILFGSDGSGNDGYALVASIDPSTKAITYGSPTVFTTSNVNSTNYKGSISAAYDTNSGKVICTYRDQTNSNYGYYIVGEVSGTSISFGTPAAFNSVTTINPSCAVYPDGTVIVVYGDSSASRGKMIAGTISGTTISWGTIAEFTDSEAIYNSIIYNADLGKMVNFYRPSNTRGTSIAINRSGTTLTTNSAHTFDTTNVQNIRATYDSDNKKMVVIFTNADLSDKGEIIVGQKKTGGSELEFGTAQIFSYNRASYYHDLAYDSTSKKVIINWNDDAYSDRPTLNYGFTSGDTTADLTITLSGSETPPGTPAGGNYSTNCGYDPNSKRFIYAYRTSDTTNLNTFYPAFFATTLTAANFIGFSNGAYTNGQSATVQIVGSVDDAQTNLTTGNLHFVQPDGSLGLTTNARFFGNAFNYLPIVQAGTAISPTKIIVKG